MTSKCEERKIISSQCEKILNKVDLVKQTTFLDQVFLGCIQRECKPKDRLVDEYRTMFESRLAPGATEKLPDSGKRKWTTDSVVLRHGGTRGAMR